MLEFLLNLKIEQGNVGVEPCKMNVTTAVIGAGGEIHIQQRDRILPAFDDFFGLEKKACC